jgi:hypothetical protein
VTGPFALEVHRPTAHQVHAGYTTPSSRREVADLRGHIVIDDDEPLPGFDTPADPPPAAPDDQAS